MPTPPPLDAAPLDAANSPACPVCGKPALGADRPFCSRGCRDRDLLQWLGDGYRLPGPPADADGLDSDAGHP